MTTMQERKQQERQSRRRGIQLAARIVFAEKGYVGASIEQIAKTAQLSVGAIYLYFKSKEDLYVSLIEDALTVFDVEFNQLHHNPDATTRLPKIWTQLIAWAQRDIEGPGVLRLLAQPGIRARLSDEMADRVTCSINNIKLHISAAVTAGAASGQYRTTSPSEFAELAWSLFIGVVEASHIQQTLAPTVAWSDVLTSRANNALALLELAIRNSEHNAEIQMHPSSSMTAPAPDQYLS
jgi:AcrR family transcriptional regulator